MRTSGAYFWWAAVVLAGWAVSVHAQSLEIPEGYSTGYHTVRPGENLRRITQNYLGSQELWQSNWALNPEISDPDFLRPGQRLHVLLQPSDAVPSAQVVTISGDVDQRPDPIAWTPAQHQDLVVESDGVRTAGQSSTALRFHDGTSLLVTEDSIVFLKVAGRTLRGIETRSVEIVEGQADLAAGDIGEGGAEMEFVIGDAISTPKAGPSGKSEARLRKSESGSAQFMVFEGESEVEAAGRSVVVSKGMGTSVPEGAAPLPPEQLLPSPTMSMPETNGNLESGNLEFSWAPVEGAAGYTVEVCTDAACEALVARTVGVAATSWVAPELPLGELQWRVTAVSPSGLDGYPSTARSFSVLPERAEFDPPIATFVMTDLAVERNLEGENRKFYPPTARVTVTVEDPSGVASWRPIIDGEPAAEEDLRGGWAHGSHTVAVRAEDQLGNTGEGGQSISFTVDGKAPELTWRVGGSELLDELFGTGDLQHREHRRWLKRGANRNARRMRRGKAPEWTLIAWGNERVDSARTLGAEDMIDGLYQSYRSLSVGGEEPVAVLLAPGILDHRSGASTAGDFLVLEASDDGAGVAELTVVTVPSSAGGYQLRAGFRDRLGNSDTATWSFASSAPR